MIGERIFYRKRHYLRTQVKSTVWVKSVVPNARAVAVGVSGMTIVASADEKGGDDGKEIL